MKLHALSSSICAFSLVGLVASAPAIGWEQMSRRTAGPGIQCWSEPNFTGKFVHYTSATISFDNCYDISADFPPYTARGLSSVKADHENFCILYPNKICDPGNDTESERLWLIGSYYNLANPEEGFAEDIQSFKCSLCTDCNN